MKISTNTHYHFSPSPLLLQNPNYISIHNSQYDLHIKASPVLH